MSTPDDASVLSQADIDALLAFSAQDREPLPPPPPPPPQPATSPKRRASPGAAELLDFAGPSSNRYAEGDLVERIQRLEEALEQILSAVRLLQADVEVSGRDVDSLTRRLGGIPEHLKASLGYRIREVFRCDTCGNSGFVAGRVMCTGCRREMWWGWWPKK